MKKLDLKKMTIDVAVKEINKLKKIIKFLYYQYIMT